MKRPLGPPAVFTSAAATACGSNRSSTANDETTTSSFFQVGAESGPRIANTESIQFAHGHPIRPRGARSMIAHGVVFIAAREEQETAVAS